MTLKWATIAATVTGLVFAAPAQAQEETPPETDAPSDIHHDGFRVAEASNGFRLVEHGIWQRPQAIRSSGGPIPEMGQADLPHRYSKTEGRGLSGFRRARYLPHVFDAERQYALPPGLLDALVWTESRYNPMAISKAGAAGLGQLMPGTARELGVVNRLDPLQNLVGAAQYLRQLLDRFGLVHLAIAAYNAGPSAVERSGGIPQNGETPAYVRNVLRYWQF